MKISIVICTWNRARLLRGALASLTLVESPKSKDWDVVLVDNNSTDDTANVAKEFSGKLPLRYVFEGRPGLSNARNTGIKSATGDYVIFIDDDVVVSKDWLIAYAEMFQRYPSAAVFGGPIHPLFEGSPPSWLPQVLSRTKAAFSALDLGPTVIELNRDVVPYGANMAFRVSALPLAPFDIALGRVAGSMVGYEEIALVQQLFDDGASGWWVPSAGLRHVIPPERQTIEFIRRYWHGSGRSVIRAGMTGRSSGSPMLLGSQLWVWKHAIVNETLYRLKKPFVRPESWIEHLKSACEAWGRIHEGMINMGGRQRLP